MKGIFTKASGYFCHCIGKIGNTKVGCWIKGIFTREPEYSRNFNKKGREEKEISGRQGIFSKLASYFKKQAAEPEPEEEFPEGNPFLPSLREILEDILVQYGREYRTFCPLLLDTDTLPESMLDEDDVELVLEQISKDLNFLKILTDRPAYFLPYIERMYEDTGLVVQIEDREEISFGGVNVILDMEQKGNCHYRYMQEGILYLPIYKRPWRQLKTPGNLDISVPIGYNTVIVKRRKSPI